MEYKISLTPDEMGVISFCLGFAAGHEHIKYELSCSIVKKFTEAQDGSNVESR